MNAKEELQKFIEVITNVNTALQKLSKYKYNQHYRKSLDTKLKDLNRSHKFLKAKIDKRGEPDIKHKFQIVNDSVAIILSNSTIDRKLNAIKDIESFWPDLEIELENLELKIRSFDIPEEIPMTEYRLDLEEGIKDFDNGCFISSLVLCRRAYEGALVTLYRSTNGEEPVEDFKCKNCSNLIRAKAYMGIAKLHKWAIDNRIISEKLKQVGFLLTDMGAGAAHPPLAEFPRDKELARLGITATLALLKEINTNKKNYQLR